MIFIITLLNIRTTVSFAMVGQLNIMLLFVRIIRLDLAKTTVQSAVRGCRAARHRPSCATVAALDLVERDVLRCIDRVAKADQLSTY